MSWYQIALLAAAAVVLAFPSASAFARRAYDWFRANGSGVDKSWPDCDHDPQEVFAIALDLRSHLGHSNEAVDAIDRVIIPAIVTMLDEVPK